jgi:hypothetical protein
MPISRLARTGCLAALVSLLALAGCAQSTVHVPPQPTVTATPTETPLPLPAPVSGLLGPAPTNCPASPSLSSMTIDDQFGGGFTGGDVFSGQSPVWNLGLAPDTALTLNAYTGQTPWPGTKVMWVVGPNFNQSVTLSGHELDSGAPIWFGKDSAQPQTTHEVLDPSTPNRGSTGREQGLWNIWGILIYFLHAGCYELDASWANGAAGWHIILAAGR